MKREWCLILFSFSFFLALPVQAADQKMDPMESHHPSSQEFLVESDSDQDGLSDRLEILFGTDPSNPDTDGDGFLDGQEVFSAYSPTSTQPELLEKSLNVKLKSQRLEQRVAGIPIATYLISSGLPQRPTPTGTFHIASKKLRAWSAMAGLWMPFWMNFTGGRAPTGQYGVHELPEWPNGTKEGEAHLGKPVSHGCVRLGLDSAKKLYEWTPIGTKVTIEKD